MIVNTLIRLGINLVDRGKIPDLLIRKGIGRMAEARLHECQVTNTEYVAAAQIKFVEMMDQSPVALLTEKANDQHYELPAAFFKTVLGEHLKYSSGYWPTAETTLDQSEAAALEIYCERAQLEDGQQVLELGCGWGSLTLYMAKKYPNSNIVAVSNSFSQAEYIRGEAERRELSNVEVITADMNDFRIERLFDRVVSIEMFEHMRNHRLLYQRIGQWLKPGGLFFKHIFVHRSSPYLFESRNTYSWMSEYFFSGGMMPNDDLPLFFQDHLKLVNRWRWDGQHYEKTANAWLKKMDANRDALQPLFKETYGDDAIRWWYRWRCFFMGVAELFGYDQGQQWWVGHYLFTKPD